MSEELGKIEKPPVEDFKSGRKLYFVPLIYPGKDAEDEFVERCDNYWEQVSDHIKDLELKLGNVKNIYHEFMPMGDEEALNNIEHLNKKSCQIIRSRVDNGAMMEVTEAEDLLTEFMDWSRCLAIGLQNREVFAKVYGFFQEASKNRNEHIARKIDETLGQDESGILFMREGHQIQFSSDIEIFYISPPALDEIKRWLRSKETADSAPETGKSDQ